MGMMAARSHDCCGGSTALTGTLILGFAFYQSTLAYAEHLRFVAVWSRYKRPCEAVAVDVSAQPF